MKETFKFMMIIVVAFVCIVGAIWLLRNVGKPLDDVEGGEAYWHSKWVEMVEKYEALKIDYVELEVERDMLKMGIPDER